MDEGASPYAGTTPVASHGAPGTDVTLVQGQTFAVSDHSGDVLVGAPQGVFLFDTRILSRWELRLDGQPVEPLTSEVEEPFAASFVGRGLPPPGRADSELVVLRRRHIGRGMREVVTVANHGLQAARVLLELVCDVDFADLFEVKESRVEPGRGVVEVLDDSTLEFRQDTDGGVDRAVLHTATPAEVTPGRFAWQVELGPGERWEVCLELAASLGGQRIAPRFSCSGADEDAEPAVRMQRWRGHLPNLRTDHPTLAATYQRSAEDLGALRIFDPDHPELAIVAAGAPWFMTVFGRDSLLTSWMTLIADPSLAHGALATLARFQGEDVDPRTEEEPGKILHEMRFGAATGLSLGGGDVYYGSIDATPLFVMMLGELRRWDPRDELVEQLVPHADRALRWIEEFGDRDGDGYVEYERLNPDGLANQGWKDSWDAIRFADGQLAATPIALCEVQGYVYAAYLARARLAEEAGDDATRQRWTTAAEDLRRRFNEDFWLEDRGWLALGLDRDKRPIDALTSNVGHCLWTGIVDPDHAEALAARLVSPEMSSGFGVRTLATSMTAYNPISYHNGSVWPHDTAICAAGLARYGHVEEANQIITEQLAVAAHLDGRLPELFAGFPRDEVGVPVPYPTSCSPQAWASAAPLMWVRTMLRLSPSAPRDTVWIDPHLPDGIGSLEVEDVRIGDHRLTVRVHGDHVEIDSTPGLKVVRGVALPSPTALPHLDAPG